MKLFLSLSGVAMILVLGAFMSIQKKQRVIFFGDSITQAGVQPGGYITRIGQLATQAGSAAAFDFVGAGIGGNKIYDLYLRADDDVLAKDPTVVVIYVGVNDVWHKRSSGTGTDADKFVRFYEALIKKIRAKGAKIVLCTPAVIGERTDSSNEQDGDLNFYSQMIRDLAARNSLPLVDLRKAFLEYNKQNNAGNKESGILTTDRVHLNDKGNQLVADEMWKVIKGL